MCFIHVLHTCAPCALYAHGRIVGLLGLVFTSSNLEFDCVPIIYTLSKEANRLKILISKIGPPIDALYSKNHEGKSWHCDSLHHIQWTVSDQYPCLILWEENHHHSEKNK